MGIHSELLGRFVPNNFAIRQTEDGAEVLTAENDPLAMAPPTGDAMQLVPDGPTNGSVRSMACA